MLPRKERLTSLGTRINSLNKAVHGDLFYVRYEKGADLALFSVTIPKAVYLKAHDRNKLKRLVYEVLRLNKQSLPKSGRFNIFAKKTVAKKTSESIKNDILSIFAKLIS